jgi:alpha-tubulin suppressor-like RCC1 family protein
MSLPSCAELRVELCPELRAEVRDEACVAVNCGRSFAAPAAGIWRTRAWVALCALALVMISGCAGGGHSGTGTTTFTIGGTVTGLTGTGLVLADNGGDNLPVAANGMFTFAAPVASGGGYAVTVVTQPTNPAETCTVTSGSGTATANVTSVAVACAAVPTFTIGGSVSGLSGTGLTLEDNGGNNLAVAANGMFTFTTAIASGDAYKVTVGTEPSNPAQSCVVTNGSGTATANVTNVAVACTTTAQTETIGGSVSGLAGTGLVLQDNGGNNLAVSANGAFTFTTAINSGSAYKVTVLTQPVNPAQVCVVTGGSGTASANVTNVGVACTTTTFTIGGSVSGLAGTGLVLQDNGGNNLAVSANGAFTFTAPINGGAAYKVTVLTQPASPAQTCAVTNGSGTATANVTNVAVACTTTTVTFSIGGTVSGLTGSGLVLQDNGGNNLAVSANGAFTFTAKVNSGAAYAVTVLTQPSSPAQTCAVTNGSGTTSANVTNVAVACTTTTVTFSIGGMVTGLSGSGLVLQDNGGNNLAVSANGAFTFTTKVNSGSAYKVTVLTEPSSPAQTCAVTNGSGTATANVTNVAVACTTTTVTFTIGGTASGLTGTGLVLQDNGGNNLSVSANGSFTFTIKVNSGTAYDVTVLTQPSSPAETCTVTNGSGTATANVTNVDVTCAAASSGTFTVGVTVTGLIPHTHVMLRDNGGDDLTVSANGPATFATAIDNNGEYAVTVETQPIARGCILGANAHGTVSGANVTVNVNCGRQLASGEFHTCALTNTGNVFCWGSNVDGQLGNGTETKSLTPVEVLDPAGAAPLSGVVAISAGQAFTCALTNAGTVFCWGADQVGQLGNGTINEDGVDLPVQVTGLTNAVTIASGHYHTCAVTTAGAAMCWGDNSEGELGTTENNPDTPVQVTGLTSGVADVTAGSLYSCAVLTDSSAMCWGDGPLGAGPSTTGSTTPVSVLNPAGTAPLTGVLEVNGGFDDACAILTDQSALCWGTNQDGDLGNGTNTVMTLPVPVTSVGSSAALGNVAQVGGGEDFICVMVVSGAIQCSGTGSFGQLGDGKLSSSESWQAVMGVSSVPIDMVAGFDQACVVLPGGGIQCWGSDLNGQLGNNNTDNSAVPVTVVGVGGTGDLMLF